MGTAPAWAGGVVVSDNGDGDGFAETRETVSFRLPVQDTSGMDLTNVTPRLAARPPVIVCWNNYRKNLPHKKWRSNSFLPSFSLSLSGLVSLSPTYVFS